MYHNTDQGLQYIRQLAGGLDNFSIEDTNRELDPVMSHLQQKGTFFLSLPFQIQWKGAITAHEPVEHEVFLRSGVNPLSEEVLSLKAVSPYTHKQHRFPLSLIYVEPKGCQVNTAFNVSPPSAEIVYTIVIPQEDVRKSSLVVIDFALRNPT